MSLGNIPSLFYFIPELTLCIAVLALLIISVYKNTDNISFYVATSSLFISLLGVFYYIKYHDVFILFEESIILDPLSNFIKVVILVSVIATIFLCFHNKEVKRDDWSEYYVLIIIATIGMLLMVSSLNLLKIYLAIEMLSIPSYMLAGFNHDDAESNEASMKYVLYGSFASGLMLFGMSWIYGQVGSLYLIDIGYHVATSSQFGITSILTFIFLFAGFGYKISSAPFHYWVPDVYQGAPSPITLFFSVAPKVAGLILLSRFLYTSMTIESFTTPSYVNWNFILGVLSTATMTIGNILAIRQKNVKRILAYSSISHVGFMMMAFCVTSFTAIMHMIFYIVIYMFMTIGAFGVLILFINKYSLRDVGDWDGIGYIHPFICSLMVLNLLSLAGLPPTSGFVSKFYILSTIIESKTFYWLAVVAIINTVIALYYYFNLARAMFLEKPTAIKPEKPEPLILAIITLFSMQGILFYFYWSDLYNSIKGIFLL